MNVRHRAATALVAALALAVPSGLVSAAEAAKPKPEKPTKTVKGQSKQLLKGIAVKDKRLARLSTSNAVERLGDDSETALVANIEEARGELADIKVAVEAADSTVDTRAARKELRSFRVENFRLATNILRKAERLTEDAAADPEATEHLGAAVEAALEIDAHSSKADVRAARAHLRSAKAELDDDADEDESEDENEDETSMS